MLGAAMRAVVPKPRSAGESTHAKIPTLGYTGTRDRAVSTAFSRGLASRFYAAEAWKSGSRMALRRRRRPQRASKPPCGGPSRHAVCVWARGRGDVQPQMLRDWYGGWDRSIAPKLAHGSAWQN